MASPASCGNYVAKETYSRYPPPPFTYNFVANVHRSLDTDEDWLPNRQDMLSGNFNVLIDLTDNSEHEGDIGFSFKNPQADPATLLRAPHSTGHQLSPLSRRSPQARLTSYAVNGLDLEQPEIPESPNTNESPATSVHSRYHGDEDCGVGLTATAVTL